MTWYDFLLLVTSWKIHFPFVVVILTFPSKLQLSRLRKLVKTRIAADDCRRLVVIRGDYSFKGFSSSLLIIVILVSKTRDVFLLDYSRVGHSFHERKNKNFDWLISPIPIFLHAKYQKI